MPQITSIEPQKKRSDRYNIYIDGKFVFATDAEGLITAKLKIGKVLEDQALAILKIKEEQNKLINSTLNFLSFRPRSQKEIEDYLAKKISKDQKIKFAQAKSDPKIAQVIKKLSKYNYINDKEFAKWWITSRITHAKGKRLIMAELQAKGIKKDLVEKALQNIPGQVALAQKAVEKKLPRWENLTPIERKKKLYAYLLTRGFDFETIAEVFAYLEKKR